MKRQISTHRQPWLRTAIYTFMTLTVTVIVALLMLVVLGYQFNQKDGKLEQGGLLQLYSTPTGATVTLDEAKLGSLTNTKTTLESGNHFVTYSMAGYRVWQKAITILPGQVEWLSYARMIPQTITPETLRTYPALDGALASPDRKYMLMNEDANQPAFTLVDIQGDTTKYSTLTLPKSSYTAPANPKNQSFTLHTWSGDDQQVLVLHTYDGNKKEWLLLNRNSPSQSIDISTTYAISPSKILFAGNGHSLLFVQNGSLVQRINLDEQTLSRPLVTNVADFTIYDEKTIAYATKPDAKSMQTVGYAAVDIPQPQMIATYPASKEPLFAALSSYFGQWYVAIVHGSDMVVQTGDLPKPGSKGSLKMFSHQTISAAATNLEVRGGGRFVVPTLKNGFATYDIELKKYDETTWKYQSKTPQPLHWLDDYTLWSDNGGTLRFYEFDGANQQDIMPATTGFDATLSQNDKYIYNVAKTNNGYILQRAKLILR